MDVRRLEEQVARATIATEAAEARRERQEAERMRRRRAAAWAKAGEVATGVDADGRWLSFVWPTSIRRGIGRPWRWPARPWWRSSRCRW